jgi:NH3-dependent NAD+ synthetase
MPAHLELLAAKSKDVRVAAGQNVALMYECSHQKKKVAIEGEEEPKKDENDMSEYEEMDELIDILTRLAKESSRHVKKQDRKEQKRSFRHILNSIENGESIKERLKLGRVKFLFHGWSKY